MGQVIARRGKDIQWMGNRSMEVNGEVKPGIRSKLYLNPARDPAMFRLVEYAAGYTEPKHRHNADEIVYVVAGEVDIGGTRYEAGDPLWIEADTDYGPLRAGPNGMTFILVRQKEANYVTS